MSLQRYNAGHPILVTITDTPRQGVFLESLGQTLIACMVNFPERKLGQTWDYREIEPAAVKFMDPMWPIGPGRPWPIHEGWPDCRRIHMGRLHEMDSTFRKSLRPDLMNVASAGGWRVFVQPDINPPSWMLGVLTQNHDGKLAEFTYYVEAWVESIIEDARSWYLLTLTTSEPKPEFKPEPEEPPRNIGLVGVPWDDIDKETGRIYPYLGMSWIFAARYRGKSGRALGSWVLPESLSGAIIERLNWQTNSAFESGRADGLASGLKKALSVLSRRKKPD